MAQVKLAARRTQKPEIEKAIELLSLLVEKEKMELAFEIKDASGARDRAEGTWLGAGGSCCNN